MPLTANYPNSLDFRNQMTRPLTWTEMDNMFRKPNTWTESTDYNQGMIVLWDDSYFAGASGALSFWLCNLDHSSSLPLQPGGTYAGGYWTRIGGLNIPGPTGPSGGPIGPQGTQGIQGRQGVQGNQGLIGPQGPQGSLGSQGAQGIQGLLGNQGTVGTVGSPGSQGTIGIQGPTGIQGTTGAGLQGIQGADGTGSQGIQGIQGPPGSGSQGIQGVQGPTGIQGAFGIQGTQGVQGLSGTPVLITMDAVNAYTNTTSQTVSIGNNGYVFFDTERTGITGASISVDNTNLANQGTRFTFTSTGRYLITYSISASLVGATSRSSFTTDLVWSDGVSSDQVIQGFRTSRILDTTSLNTGSASLTDTISASGVLNITSSSPNWLARQIYVIVNSPSGNASINLIQNACSISIVRLEGGVGPTGAQGIQGTSASQGLQGIQGPSGSGSQGTIGSQGTQGAGGSGSGTQGTIGSQGIQGTEGSQGIQGTVGQQGIQGTIGAGTQGTVGQQGIQGTIGTGTQGTEGAIGIGTQGIQGTQGTEGQQGTQGTIGTGLQGTQGTDGSQGIQGNQGQQGTQGTIGTGIQGTEGQQGTQGTIGSQGTQGTIGSQGTQGTIGSQGTQGITGAQGIQGIQGTLGPQGTLGTGLQGTQGTSGGAGKTAISTNYKGNYAPGVTGINMGVDANLFTSVSGVKLPQSIDSFNDGAQDWFPYLVSYSFEILPDADAMYGVTITDVNSKAYPQSYSRGFLNNGKFYQVEKTFILWAAVGSCDKEMTLRVTSDQNCIITSFNYSITAMGIGCVIPVKDGSFFLQNYSALQSNYFITNNSFP